MDVQKYVKGHMKKVDEFIAKDDWRGADEVIADHLVQIQFVQHERLIHLMVTFFFGAALIAAAVGAVVTGELMVIVLDVIFLLLVIPYIWHYYFLENNTQKMYEQYNRLMQMKK